MNPQLKLLWLLPCFLAFQLATAQNNPPFYLKENIFQFNLPNTLGLSKAPGTETFTVFSPSEQENHYNHGAVLFPFKNKLYAMWQTSKTDEDSPDTHMVYSVSDDGEKWSKPMLLAPAMANGMVTSGGWWQHGNLLIAFINFWPNANLSPKQGVTKFITSEDGISWTAPKEVLDINNKPVKGVIEQDLRALPNGRIITAFHIQPGLIAKPFYTDDPSATKGWKQANMKNLPSKKSDMSREIEPSWFYQKNGNLVMVFRDQENSFRKWAAISNDNGENWSSPQITNFYDSRAKQSAGNLPDGTAFQVNNPTGNKSRIPLVIALANDGYFFNKAFLLRAGDKDLPEQKYPGKFKSIGYSYPKSVIWKGKLYVAYATNKELIEITRVNCDDLMND